MNFYINKARIFLRIEEYGLSLSTLSKLSNLSMNYLNKMLAGKTKKILPFLNISKILNLPLSEMILFE